MRISLLALIVIVGLSAFASQAAKTDNRPVAQLYRGYCGSCHGRDGRAKTSKGRFSHARDLTDTEWQADVSDERIFNSIMNGRDVRGHMPAFAKKLNEQEINSLVDFVRKLKA